MAHALAVPPPGFEALSVEEQIDYVQALWDAIAAKPDRIPIPDWHREILEERLADFESDPEEGVLWEDFRAELLAEDPRKGR